MAKENSKFNQFRKIYNKSFKEAMNLPWQSMHKKIDKILGVQSAKNLVQASYMRNAKLIEEEYK